MTQTPITDSRHLATAVGRLDDVSATDREAAAKHVFDVYDYDVTRVRKTNAALHHRGHDRITHSTHSTPLFLFALIYPHIKILPARRLNCAMPGEEASPHRADATALIGTADSQGVLGTHFGVLATCAVDEHIRSILSLRTATQD